MTLLRPTMGAIPLRQNVANEVLTRRVLRPYHNTPRVTPRAWTNDVSSVRPLLPHRRRCLRGAAMRFDFGGSHPSLPCFRSFFFVSIFLGWWSTDVGEAQAETNPETFPRSKGRSTLRICPGCVRLQMTFLCERGNHMPSHNPHFNLERASGRAPATLHETRGEAGDVGRQATCAWTTGNHAARCERWRPWPRKPTVADGAARYHWRCEACRSFQRTASKTWEHEHG
mmetsp:Transcript_4406/g.28112  ORF Transcript_4406/g.28112 Transcript_4406/m.28112 type:complete len:227 (+) Transcript_4406:250-930(+)